VGALALREHPSRHPRIDWIGRFAAFFRLRALNRAVIASNRRSDAHSCCPGTVSRNGTPRALSDGVITILLMMTLLVTAVLALPAWPYAEKWGYYPTGACGAIVATMAALILAGRL
jgi:hypothetical protein